MNRLNVEMIPLDRWRDCVCAWTCDSAPVEIDFATALVTELDDEDDPPLPVPAYV